MNIFVAIPQGEIRQSFLDSENVAFLESLGRLTWNESADFLTPEQLRDKLVDVDVLVCAWGTPQLDAYVLQKANRLKLVAYTCGSVANVVSDAMYAKGIRIVCGNEVFARSVAEGTIAYMLCGLRFLPYNIRYMQENGWKPASRTTFALTDQTVGIIGYGAISRYLLEMLRPFGVKVKLYSGHMTQEQAQALGVQKASLEEIFSTCKVISLHSARNAKNYHMIDEHLLSLIQKDALLVNTARGDIIDEEALVRQVQTGRFRAVLDVYEEEPLSMESGLRGLDNVILLPHQGGPTFDRRCAAGRVVLEDIQRLQQGLPLQNEISPSRAAMMTH